MTDIFISYSSKDRAWVQGLATALENQGYRVWWDTGLLSGDDFHNTIPEKLAEAACVIVVWTPNSVESLWVKAEANRGLRRKVLIPILAGDTEIPIPFDMIHSDSFREWTAGDVNAIEFKRLLLAVSRYTEPSLLLEQAAHEAKLEAERRRKEQEEAAKRQQAEEEQRKKVEVAAEQGRQQREQKAAEKARLAKEAEDKRLEEEAQARRIAEQQERERLEAEKAAEAQRQAEQEQEREQAQTVQPEQSESVSANDSEPPVSPTPQKAGMGTGVKVGGGLAAVGVVAALVYLGAKPSPEPAPVYLSEPVATTSTVGSEPDASGFQAVADPGQMGKVDFSEPEMVRIEGGRFKMGCVSGKGCSSDEKPVHTVNVPSFEIGKYEVTFDEWGACVADGGCKHKPDDAWGRGRQPVMRVSWNDVQGQYIPWLNKKTGKQYRLPTEAEWEYAARAGTTAPYSLGDCLNTDQANYDGNYAWGSCEKTGNYRSKTLEVGSFQDAGNAFGLYDVHGNVWEWVQDCYHDNYKGAPTDGSTWDTKCGDTEYRVLRGGSWINRPESLRSAIRTWNTPSFRTYNIGFRLARTL